MDEPLKTANVTFVKRYIQSQFDDTCLIEALHPPLAMETLEKPTPWWMYPSLRTRWPSNLTVPTSTMARASPEPRSYWVWTWRSSAVRSTDCSVTCAKFIGCAGKSTEQSISGPSGCGKTTLLKCIVGKLKLDSGSVIVFGDTPGPRSASGVPGPRVGYMPQELALFGEFNIEETLTYFRRIFGMSEKKYQERLDFLMKFLDLPSRKRKLINMSGGQQRRASLAVALLHEPELLILDEPTVSESHWYSGPFIWWWWGPLSLPGWCWSSSENLNLEAPDWDVIGRGSQVDDRHHDPLYWRGSSGSSCWNDEIRKALGRRLAPKPLDQVSWLWSWGRLFLHYRFAGFVSTALKRCFFSSVFRTERWRTL